MASSVRVIVRISFGFCAITKVCHAESVSSRSLASAGGPPVGPRAPPEAATGSGHGGRTGGAHPGGRGRRGVRRTRRGRGRHLPVPGHAAAQAQTTGAAGAAAGVGSPNVNLTLFDFQGAALPSIGIFGNPVGICVSYDPWNTPCI